MEPFDDSMPELLKNNGVYSHMVTDHQHYWEDGGGTYHPRYSSYELIRGQEGDPWKGEVADPEMPDMLGMQHDLVRQDWVNRKYIREEKDFHRRRRWKRPGVYPAKLRPGSLVPAN
ncbi:hypothetical protein HMSSN036_41450 [Paenibacillus macerans]|nr:hypothetical protein HMSSN036_41450 [Paenibacillus macerans]